MPHLLFPYIYMPPFSISLINHSQSFGVVATTMHNMGQEECNTNLALGIGACGDQKPSTSNGDRRIKKPPVQLHVLFPKEEKHQDEYSVGSGSLSRSRSRSTDEEEEEAAAAGGSGGGGGGRSYLGGTRKKLRLTTAQVALLEDSFREQNILNPVQKRGLADRLNIQPRQVEVWFQNRRARTKLKQTEVDCEYLKKRCDSLSTENRRLKKELQELEAMAGRPGSPLYMHLLKAAKLTMCPSCEQVAAAGVGRVSKTSSGAGCIKDQLLSAVNSRILSL